LRMPAPHRLKLPGLCRSSCKSLPGCNQGAMFRWCCRWGTVRQSMERRGSQWRQIKSIQPPGITSAARYLHTLDFAMRRPSNCDGALRAVQLRTPEEADGHDDCPQRALGSLEKRVSRLWSPGACQREADYQSAAGYQPAPRDPTIFVTVRGPQAHQGRPEICPTWRQVRSAQTSTAAPSTSR
jgi:hypothetical protein